MNRPEVVKNKGFAKEVRFYRSQLIANAAIVITSLILGGYLHSIGGFPWIMGLPVVISGFSTFSSYKNYKKFVKFQTE